MIVDWSIRFGDVVSFLGFALGGLSVIFMMKSDIRALAMELGFVKETVNGQSKEIERFAELLNTMGRYEERFLMMRRELDDLKRGKGYINNKESNEKFK